MTTKNKVLIFALSFLLFNSCIFTTENNSKNNGFPFRNNNIDSIGFSKNKGEKYIILKDTLLLKQINEVLHEINSEKLIKGQRQHGAKNLYSLKLFKNGNDLLVFVNQTKENKITIDFFEESKRDDFSYFLGCLYESKTLFEILKSRLSEF